MPGKPQRLRLLHRGEQPQRYIAATSAAPPSTSFFGGKNRDEPVARRILHAPGAYRAPSPHIHTPTRTLTHSPRQSALRPKDETEYAVCGISEWNDGFGTGAVRIINSDTDGAFAPDFEPPFSVGDVIFSPTSAPELRLGPFKDGMHGGGSFDDEGRSNGVSTVVVVSDGEGCTVGTHYVDGATRAGVVAPAEHASVRIEVCDAGAVTNVEVTNTGNGNSEAPVIELPVDACSSSSSTPPVFEAILNGVAGSMWMGDPRASVWRATRQGTGYTSPPSLVVVGGGGGAGFQPAELTAALDDGPYGGADLSEGTSFLFKFGQRCNSEGRECTCSAAIGRNYLVIEGGVDDYVSLHQGATREHPAEKPRAGTVGADQLKCPRPFE